MNLAEKLKELRVQHHYSQEQVAEMIHVTRQAISKWETGKSYPDVENLKLLSSLYGVTVDTLLNDVPAVGKKEEGSDCQNIAQQFAAWYHREKPKLFILLVLFVLTLFLQLVHSLALLKDM